MGTNSFLISNIATDDNHEDNIGYLMRKASRVRVISPYVTEYGIDFILKNTSEDAEMRRSSVSLRFISVRNAAPVFDLGVELRT